MHITTVGLDLAKQVFQVCVMSAGGKTRITHRKLTRAKFVEAIVRFEPTVIAMEACARIYVQALQLGEPVLL